MNKAIILGHLGQDPELKETTKGTKVVNLSVATTEKFNDEKRTEWHRVVAFNATAENCAKYLTKGRQVLVEGRIQTREWEKDGVKRYSTEIIADRVQFLGGGDKKAEGENEKIDF
jgi:single-strand DNA-binding protein